MAVPQSSSSTLGKMADISKDQLRKEITAILKNADLTKTSGKQVRQQLEEKLDVDLADQKKVVDKLVLEIVEEQQRKSKKKGKKSDDDDDEEEDEEDNDDENGEGNEDDDEEDSDAGKKKKKAPKRAAPKKKKKASDSDEGSDDDADDKDDDYSPSKKAKTAAKKGGKRKKKGSDSESDEDWGKSKKKRGGGGGGGGARKGGGQGYTRPYTLSPELAKLMGQDAMPRHEVVRKIWAIIKERNLYDPKNKQFAVCDDDLMKVFNVRRFRTFGMMKYLKDHFKG